MAEVVVEFAARSQSLAALREAAYRLIGQASCQIDSRSDVHVCRLIPATGARVDEAELRGRFLDLVTDQNLREQVEAKTAGIRNVIVALAFGALASPPDSGE